MLAEEERAYKGWAREDRQLVLNRGTLTTRGENFVEAWCDSADILARLLRAPGAMPLHRPGLDKEHVVLFPKSEQKNVARILSRRRS